VSHCTGNKSLQYLQDKTNIQEEVKRKKISVAATIQSATIVIMLVIQ
jgi:hypothetical protein